MELWGLFRGYRNLLGYFNRGPDSWDDPGGKSLLIAVMLPIRELNLSAPFFCYTDIEVVLFQQHLYEPIMPIFGGQRRDVRLRSSEVLGFVSSVIAVPATTSSCPAAYVIAVLPGNGLFARPMYFGLIKQLLSPRIRSMRHSKAPGVTITIFRKWNGW